MLHEETEPAFKIKSDNFTDDSGEGLWKFVSNETLVSISNSEEFTDLSTAFRDVLNLYSSVVPSVLLSDVRTELKMAISELESATQHKNFEAVQVLSILNSFHKVTEKLADIECRYKVDMNKELKRNDICFSQTKAALNGLDFISKNSIEQTDFCVYRKSMIDMYFYKECGATVSSAVIKRLEKDNDDDTGGDEYGEVDGLAKFKFDFKNMKNHYAQVFADMVRVGSLLACGALFRGKIIDKIVVYGLLVDYESSSAVIFKYHVNFLTDETTFSVGKEINAVRGLASIVKTMTTMC